MRWIAAVAALATGCCGATVSQYPTKYHQGYGNCYQPYYYVYPQYCPPAKAEPREDAFDLFLKEAKLRKAISELPPDQRAVMLKRLGWYREPERPAPGGVPPLTTDEVERLRGKLNPK